MSIGATAAMAAPLNFDFSFTNTSGNFAGTVTGQILGLLDNTNSQQATGILLTSTGGLPGTAENGNDILDWISVSQSFDVSGGVITSAFVTASTNTSLPGATFPVTDDFFCLLTSSSGCGASVLGGSISGTSLLMLNGNTDPNI